MRQAVAAQDSHKVNDKIRATEVRVIADDGSQLGVLSIKEALARAEEVGLDLVEISPDAKPPVCKLIDYGKFKYQQSKKAQETKKKQTVIEVKEIQLTPSTNIHDLQTKANHIKRWIAEKARVKVFVKFKGREMSHSEIGYKTLTDLISLLSETIIEEAPPKFEGRRLCVTLLPKSEKNIVGTTTSVNKINEKIIQPVISKLL